MRKNKRHIRGMSLIEVIIALCILGIVVATIYGAIASMHGAPYAHVYVSYETVPVYGYRYDNGHRVRYIVRYNQFRVRRSRSGMILKRVSVPYQRSRVGSRVRTSTGKVVFRSARTQVRVRSARYRSSGSRYRSSGSRYRSSGSRSYRSSGSRSSSGRR